MKNIKNIIFLLSIISFSFVCSVCSNSEVAINKHEIISVIISFCFGIYLIKKDFIDKTIKKASKTQIIISIIIILITLNEVRMQYDLLLATNSIVDFLVKFGLLKVIKVGTKIFSTIFLFIFVLYLIRKVTIFIKNFIKEFDNYEKKYIYITSLIGTLIIIMIYSSTNKLWFAWDRIFSMDSHYVSTKMFYNIFWTLDIRHIFFSIIACPFKILVSPILYIFPNFGDLYYILLAIFNLYILIIIAIMLKRLTNNKWMLLLYTLSFPFLQYAFIIEKYQIAIFFIILFLYEKFHKSSDLEEIAIVSSVGMMSTSALIGILCGRGKLKERIKYWFKVIILFFCVCALFGKINIIIEFKQQLDMLMNGIPIKSTFTGQIYAISELFSSILFIPAYHIVNGNITWLNQASTLNILGVILFVISIIGFIYKRNDKFTQSCMVWEFVIFIMFIIMNWYCYEAPLFNIYFSWAIITLIANTIEMIKDKNTKKYVYYLLIFMLVVVNFSQLIKIYNYILTLG